MSTVSIIVPVFNSSNYVTNCIQSISNQTYTDIEIIVVDDCSSDDSVTKIKNLMIDDSRIRLYTNDYNYGVAKTRNVGISHSNGRFVAFCDSDDIWYPRKLEIQIEALSKSDAIMCHSSSYYVGNKKNLMKTIPIVKFDDMKIRNWIGNSTAIIDKSKTKKIIQSSNKHEDYEMWCKILGEREYSIGIIEPLVEINRRSNSLTGNKFFSIIWHLQAQRRIFKMTFLEIFFRLCQNFYYRLK